MDTLVEDRFGDDGEPIRRIVNLIEGPNGWTESLDDHAVDVLFRMGAIRLAKTTSARGWQTNFYDTVGRFEEKK